MRHVALRDMGHVAVTVVCHVAVGAVHQVAVLHERAILGPPNFNLVKSLLFVHVHQPPHVHPHWHWQRMYRRQWLFGYDSSVLSHTRCCIGGEAAAAVLSRDESSMIDDER